MKSISDLLNLSKIKLTFLKACFVLTGGFVPHPLAFSVMDDFAPSFLWCGFIITQWHYSQNLDAVGFHCNSNFISKFPTDYRRKTPLHRLINLPYVDMFWWLKLDGIRPRETHWKSFHNGLQSLNKPMLEKKARKKSRCHLRLVQPKQMEHLSSQNFSFPF